MFTIAGTVQMTIWAKQKHRAYKKEFGDKYPKQWRWALLPALSQQDIWEYGEWQGEILQVLKEAEERDSREGKEDRHNEERIAEILPVRRHKDRSGGNKGRKQSVQELLPIVSQQTQIKIEHSP